jgi:hypothetical protein
MERSVKNTLTMLGLFGLIAALALGFGIGMLGRATALAAPSSQTALTTGSSSDARPAGAATDKATNEKLMDSFIANFTSRLGVDEAKLNAAFTSAVNDTLDQAVRDGTITQAQATEAKAKGVTQEGLRGLLQRGFSSGESSKGDAEQEVNPKTAIFAALNDLGISLDELRQGIDAGKSIVEVAAAHNVDATALKNAIMAKFRSELDGAVRSGKLTQAQADVEYQKLTGPIDDIISGKNRAGGDGKIRSENDISPSLDLAERAALNAASTALGMQPIDMKMALGSGKPLADLVREKGKDQQTVRSAMLSAGKAPLDAAVTAKTLTQAQAGQEYTNLTAWVDAVMSQGLK